MGTSAVPGYRRSASAILAAVLAQSHATQSQVKGHWVRWSSQGFCVFDTLQASWLTLQRHPPPGPYCLEAAPALCGGSHTWLAGAASG